VARDSGRGYKAAKGDIFLADEAARLLSRRLRCEASTAPISR
jgi:hypothetical protein